MPENRGAQLPIDPDLLLTTAQAAKLCGVAPSTVRSWALRGALPSAGRGWYRLGDVIEVERIVQAGGQGPVRGHHRAAVLDVLAAAQPA